MYFRNYGPRKTLLDQCLKSPFSRDPSKATWKMRPNIVEMSRTAPLLYLLITVKAIVYQTVSVSDTQNLKTVS